MAGSHSLAFGMRYISEVEEGEGIQGEKVENLNVKVGIVWHWVEDEKELVCRRTAGFYSPFFQARS